MLTCAHVVEALQKLDKLGVVGFSQRDKPKRQAPQIETQFCSPLSVGKSPWTADGPDLAFLRLPESFLSTLGAFCTILNGNLEKQRTLLPTPDDTICFDVVVGVVHEWTKGPELTPNLATTYFNSLANVGRIERSFVVGGLDMLEFRPVPEQNFSLPKSYEGTSGGGLWRFWVRNKGGTVNLVRSVLRGVAFWETDDRRIICHGPEGLYGDWLSKIPPK